MVLWYTVSRFDYFNIIRLTDGLAIIEKFGVMYSLIPLIAPGRVTPLISRMNNTTYGNKAVNHTTCEREDN